MRFPSDRKVSYQKYGLDPVKSYTVPGYSWKVLMKMTKIKLKLLIDPEMYIFTEKMIRGGISVCSMRHPIPYNKYLENYDSTKESSYVMYLDANNLYGWAMIQYLPYDNFEWVEKEWEINEILNLEDEAEIGYIFEVDLEYPRELHDLHNDYPMAPERLTITINDLSEYQNN